MESLLQVYGALERVVWFLAEQLYQNAFFGLTFSRALGGQSLASAVADLHTQFAIAPGESYRHGSPVLSTMHTQNSGLISSPVRNRVI